MDKKVYILGFFDALHIGHRKLIAEGKRLADLYNAELCMVTFDDNIYSALERKDKEIYLLRERKEIALSIGIDSIHVLPTDKAFLNLSFTQFLDYINELNPVALVVGKDYKFGCGAKGCASDLTKYFSEKSITVSVVDLVNCNGEKVSSTKIKQYLSLGMVDKANELLVNPYSVVGNVVDGLKNGRKIGFPTANIDLDNRKLMIKTGVYMTKTTVFGQKYLSVTSVGSHPTVDVNTYNLETHILDFDKYIYKNDIKIEFYKYIRDIRKCSTLDELHSQIQRDINLTKKELLL